MKRSEFVKLSCTGCLLGAAGLLSISGLLSSCSPKSGASVLKTTVTGNKMLVAISQLELRPVSIIRGSGMEFDVAVHKNADGMYEALLLRCTHFSNPLAATGNGYLCTLHGSVFDAAGKVKKGPAAQPLKQLSCTVADGNLVISIS